MKVMKFGGTSVGKPERMHQVVSLVTRDTEPKLWSYLLYQALPMHW
jgi:aspartate kinase